jgi:hypothetical protein
MAFVPLVLLAATKLIKGKSKRESRGDSPGFPRGCCLKCGRALGLG